jgi:pimeloyl-ACP methyl ester carboxylesterase
MWDGDRRRSPFGNDRPVAFPGARRDRRCGGGTDEWPTPACGTTSHVARNTRRGQMLEICGRLRSFGRPALVIWAPEDRVQRPDHGRRLAALLPNARPEQGPG